MRCTSSIEIACIPSGSSALPPVPADRPPYGSNWIYLLKLDATRIRLEPVTRRKATVARILRNSRPGVRLNEHLEQPDGWIALSVRPASQSSRDLARPAVRREADEDWGVLSGNCPRRSIGAVGSMGAPVSLIQNNSGHLKYLSRAVSYRHNPEDAVQNGRRHVDVNLLGMWWSPPVVVLRLRGMRR